MTERLRRKLKKANAVAYSLEQSNKLLSQELGSQRHKIAILEAEVAELESMNKDLRKEVATLKQKLTRLTKKLEQEE